MKKTVLLIDHPVGQRDDRASRCLAERGFALQWCCPGKGETLPASTDEHVAVVVYGGAESVNDLDEKHYLRAEIDWIERWLAGGKPYFGICLGGQLLARALGAPVGRHPEGLHEIGYVEIEPAPGANGFLAGPQHVYHWHNEGFEVPQTAQLLASGPVFPNQAFRYGEKAYGIQFHPEVTPAVFSRWIEEAGHMLEEPGAQPAEQHHAGAAEHDGAMADWLNSFFDHWLEEV